MNLWHGRRCFALGNVIAALGMVVAGGCGSGDDLPRLPISGRVTFDGEPLSGAWIEFRPKGGADVTTLGAMIDEGRFSVSRSDGLVPGDYRVTISKAEAPDAGGAMVKSEPLPKGKVTKAMKLKKAAPNPFGFAKQLIPEQYNRKSQLVAKVEEGKANDFEFALTSK